MSVLQMPERHHSDCEQFYDAEEPCTCEALTRATQAVRQRLYVDVAAILDGNLQETPTSVCLRLDGTHLFYAGKVNPIYGESESGKTWLALAAVAEQLNAGGRCLYLDADHNGAEIIKRLAQMGVPHGTLRDVGQFSLMTVEDHEQVREAVADAQTWLPTVVVVDSQGEFLSMNGKSSMSTDEYLVWNREVQATLASLGACVLSLDHTAKSGDPDKPTQLGTVAKKNAVSGVQIHVQVIRPFVPGHGGTARLRITKDRPGYLRSRSPLSDKGAGQYAGVFELVQQPNGLAWHVSDPNTTQPPSAAPKVLLSPEAKQMAQVIRDAEKMHGKVYACAGHRVDTMGELNNVARLAGSRANAARDWLQMNGYLRIYPTKGTSKAAETTERNPDWSAVRKELGLPTDVTGAQ